MSINQLPLVIEPQALKQILHTPQLVIVDLCKTDIHTQLHVPGSLHLDYRHVVSAKPPVMGLLPDPAGFSQTLSTLGITPDTHVVAYDEEGGGKASRFLYTLDVIGHRSFSLLDGGIHAWANEKMPAETTINSAEPSEYPVEMFPEHVATRDYILSHLGDKNVVLLDARTTYEFEGTKKFSEKAGRIPGAVNLDWVLMMDKNNNLRLQPPAMLNEMLSQRGISHEKTVVTYCQSHHRSALVYHVLKSLGYNNIKGYSGSWSDWGNHPETPVETGVM